MSEKSGVAAMLKALRSQIMISAAMAAMMASFIEERIHEAFSMSDRL